MKRTAIILSLLSTTASAAGNRFYSLDTSTWTLYSVTQCASPIVGAAAFQAGQRLGTVGPPGYAKGGSYTTGYHLAANSLNELSISYKWVSGATGAHLCVDGNITGYPTHQCVDFNGQNGTINNTDPAIKSAVILPLGVDGGFWVSLVFKTAAAFEYGNQAFAYAQLNATSCSAWWNGQIVAGQTP